jgi:hypothetical protein
MSVIKESKVKAQEAILAAIAAMDEYYNELEADEDFGPVFDGSTMGEDLIGAIDRLQEARAYFASAHNRSHWGM